MTLTADQIVDRRSLRRKVSFWRVIAFLAIAAALIVGIALVAGRDQDRRYAEFRSPRRGKRLAHAFSRLFSQMWETVRRTVLHHRDVGIPTWQAPAAFLLWSGFVVLTFAGDVGHVFRGPDDVVETVPDAIKVS